MDTTENPRCAGYTTGRLAAAAGYCVQQVRDLERLEVLPAADRDTNGYRRFGAVHLTALRAYRHLAGAVGPVLARARMREIRGLPYGEALARIVALHVDLARSRQDAVSALRALDSIAREPVQGGSTDAADSMSITELAAALDVRSSTLRFWEREALLTPERVGTVNARSYPVSAIREARIVAALRAGGYPIPAVRAVMASLRDLGATDDARHALEARIRSIATRSEALVRAGTDLADLLSVGGGGPD